MVQYHIIGTYTSTYSMITDKDGEKMNQNKYTEWDEFLGLSEEALIALACTINEEVRDSVVLTIEYAIESCSASLTYWSPSLVVKVDVSSKLNSLTSKSITFSVYLVSKPEHSILSSKLIYVLCYLIHAIVDQLLAVDINGIILDRRFRE